MVAGQRSLTIQIDASGLSTLQAAGQAPVLVKSFVNRAYAVIWQKITLAEQVIVTWSGEYQVFASTTQLAAGASLQVNSHESATAGQLYSFSGGQFGAESAGLPTTDQIGIANQDAGFGVPNGIGTFGVAETAQLGGQQATNPLDAQAVPAENTAYSVLTERVFIFPASGVSAGSIIDRAWLGSTRAVIDAGIVLGAPLLVDLTTTASQTVYYSDTSHGFMLGSAS